MLSQYLEREAFSHATRRSWGSMLTQFQAWLGRPLEEVTEDDIIRYLREKRYARPELFLNALKNYLRWYVAHMEIPITPEELRRTLATRQRIDRILDMRVPSSVRVPRLRNRKKVVPIEVLGRVLKIAAKKSEREHDIFYVNFYFGARKGELAEPVGPLREEMLARDPHRKWLTYEDVDWSKRRIVLQTEKTRIPRVLYFDRRTAKVLRRALKKGHFKVSHENEWNQIFDKYARVAGIHLFPHQGRSTFIHYMRTAVREAYEAGDIDTDPDYMVKALAGHKIQGVDMTDLYDEAFEEDIEKVMTEYHYFRRLNNGG